MASYTHTTYLQFRQIVARAQSDPNNIFWTDTENKSYCLEALRTWNALAWYSRDRGQFATSNGVAFYDLPSLLIGGTNLVPQIKLTGFNIKDQDLYTDLKYALMEDASTVNTWTGTDQFDQLSIQDEMNSTRNQFLFETGLLSTHSSFTIAPNWDGIVGLGDNIIHIQRVAFKSNVSTDKYIPLKSNDEYSATGYNPNWSLNPGTPIGYSTIMKPKVALQLIPSNGLAGTLDLVTVNAPTDLNLSSGVLLNVPDDLAWILKYGILSSLLYDEGQRNDKQRADYCLQRYQQGVILAKLWNRIQQAMINGVPLIVSSIEKADDYKPLWQNNSGQPTDILACSPNLIALGPVPDANGPYSVAMDVIRNFPIPSADGDFIQVGREELDIITNYIVHLSSFKQGGQEFIDTLPLAQEMFDLAAYYNKTLMALAPSLFSISKQSDASKAKKLSMEIAA